MIAEIVAELASEFNDVNWVLLTIQSIYTTIVFIIVVYFLEKHIVKSLETGRNVIRENERIIEEPRKLISKPFKVILKNGKRRKKYNYPLR